MTRATIGWIDTDVYCSSTSHYGVSVRLVRGSQSMRYEFDFDGSLLWKGKRDWRERACPKYIQAAILARLRELYTAGKIRVYEHDRDGNRRYNDLRYHERKHFEWLIGLRTV